jgi:hypothetical protein
VKNRPSTGAASKKSKSVAEITPTGSSALAGPEPTGRDRTLYPARASNWVVARRKSR